MGDLDHEGAFLRFRQDGQFMVPGDVDEPCDGHGQWGSGSQRVTVKGYHGISEMIVMMIMSMIGIEDLGIDERCR